MKRVSKPLIVVTLLLFAAISLAGAQEQNIVERVAEDRRFDTLEAAIEAAGLNDMLSGGEWTLFAPTDGAFNREGLNQRNIADAFSQEELASMVLYHVLPGNVHAADGKMMLGDITMANGEPAGLKFFRRTLWVNDVARVTEQDIVASNGVIHAVNNVILPPWPRVTDEQPALTPAPASPTNGNVPAAEADAHEELEAGASVVENVIEGNSIVALASQDGQFSTLVAALDAAGLTSSLAGGNWTLFAPTDAAFALLGLDASNIATTYTQEELADLLLYHALNDSVSTAEAKGMLGDIRMANGRLAGLKFFEDSLWVNDDARVIRDNIIAGNGTIHVVDHVILGPWPRE